MVEYLTMLRITLDRDRSSHVYLLNYEGAALIMIIYHESWLFEMTGCP